MEGRSTSVMDIWFDNGFTAHATVTLPDGDEVDLELDVHAGAWERSYARAPERDFEVIVVKVNGETRRCELEDVLGVEADDFLSEFSDAYDREGEERRAEAYI